MDDAAEKPISTFHHPTEENLRLPLKKAPSYPKLAQFVEKLKLNDQINTSTKKEIVSLPPMQIDKITPTNANFVEILVPRNI